MNTNRDTSNTFGLSFLHPWQISNLKCRLFFSTFHLSLGIGRPQGFSSRERPDSFERIQKKQIDKLFRNATQPARQIWRLFGRELISNMIPRRMFEVHKENCAIKLNTATDDDFDTNCYINYCTFCNTAQHY